MLRISCAIIFVFKLSLYCGAQELPPIQSFYPQTYKAGDQNWAITQDAQKIIYVANNKGLLSYNGTTWSLSATPNQSIMRSVLAVGDRIFSGQYRDFGYWQRDDFGALVYTSLMQEFDLYPLEDEEFWGIAALGDWLMFQSLDRIYILNEATRRINIIESETTLTEMVLVGDTIVFQKIGQGIFKIENGKQQLITDDSLIRSAVMVDAYKREGVWYVVTQNSGIYQMSNGTISSYDNPIQEDISDKSIYSGKHLRNGYYALGSISNGLLLFDSSDELVYQIDQTNGLSNNTVLAVFEDVDGNIWMALDNGISVINQNSRLEVYYDQEGLLGTVYAAIIHDDLLYLGTNQGLFYRNDYGEFTLVQGTEGQVWSLNSIDDKLFCGHDRGTYIISSSSDSERFSNVQGTWKVKPIPGRKGLLLQGNYNGLYVLEASEDSWVMRNKIDGFNTSSRYFEFISPQEIVVSHEYKGLFYIKFDEEFRQIISIRKDSLPPSVNSSLVTYQDKIFYAANDGIYSFSDVKYKFQEDSIVSQLTDYSNYVSGKLMLTDNKEKMWYASEEGLSYAQPDNLTGDFTVSHVALPLRKRATKSGYENILQLSEQRYLLGTTKGYMILDLSKDLKLSPEVRISEIANWGIGESERAVSKRDQTDFRNAKNSFRMAFYASFFETYSTPEFRYRLKGYYDQWSSWEHQSEVTFDNLPAGDYEFEVQSKIGNQISTTDAVYKFSIAKPVYLSIEAFMIYLLLLVAVGFVTHFLYRGYYKRQRTRLIISKEKELEFKEMESREQIMKFRNENLQLDIENKNRELGLSTMNLIQKNELLNDIKNQLNKVSSLQDVKSVVRLINRQLNTSADWKVFEEAFNNADKEFLKDVKSKHPNLTSNDLRLCAYLRLNLSSKEIAPLLNISHKSVEVKRYRLRKKMNLDHEVNLTDYILQI